MEPLSSKDPESIGDYTLIGRLGSGGMGIVYLAANGPDSVALKVIRESLLEDPSQATRFSREIETLKKINSPYVAKIINSGVTDGQAWYATEFVNGPDLKSLVDAKGPLKGDAWMNLAKGLLQGISAIHALGIIHRDIKPANVIVAELGPKIIDFGIAQVGDATSVTSTGLVAGTPAWFSPEQIEGKTLTVATDLFSAGSVLTYAATGKSPWGDENTMTKASVYGILVAEPNLSGASPLQLRIISALLKKEPSDRQFPEELRETPQNELHSKPESAEAAERKPIKPPKTYKPPKVEEPNNKKPLPKGIAVAIASVAVVAASVAIAAALASTESGVGVSETAPAEETFEVYALLPQIPHGTNYLPAMEAKAAELGINLTITNSEYDGYKQASECEAAIAAKPDGIILWPGLLDAVTPCVTAADAAGIPVWISLAEVNDADKPLTYGYSGMDSYGQGAASAEIMCEIVGDAEIGIILINGLTGDSVATLRGIGFKETVAANCPNVTILAEQPGNWNVDDSQIAASEMLTSVGVEAVQGMWAADERMVEGGIDAFKARDIAVEDLFITSIGNSVYGNALVGSGELDGTIFHSASWEGENAVIGIYSAMTGGTEKGRDDVASVRYMPNPKVTIDNWDDVSVKPEW